MAEPAGKLETTGGLTFFVDAEVRSLSELGFFIQARATAPPKSGEELVETRTTEGDEVNEDALLDGREFTEAEARYLGGIVDFCIEHPERSAGLISLTYIEGVTDVVIEFPVLMEPPAELK